MSETGLTVPCMTELPCRYDVTITVNRDDGSPSDPAEFAAAAERAASARVASQSRSLVQLGLTTILISGLLNFHAYTVETTFHSSDARAMISAERAMDISCLPPPDDC